MLLFDIGILAATGDGAGAIIIVAIIILSIALLAVQERKAAKAAEALKQSLSLKLA